MLSFCAIQNCLTGTNEIYLNHMDGELHVGRVAGRICSLEDQFSA
jgi:hypothetical protein